MLEQMKVEGARVEKELKSKKELDRMGHSYYDVCTLDRKENNAPSVGKKRTESSESDYIDVLAIVFHAASPIL